MPILIKIISISNAHQWDGVTMTSEEFLKLKEVLQLSKFHHIINWEEVQ